MPNRSHTIVLVEDERHKMLIYRYLLRRGLSRYDIRIKPAPVGEGSAERWVRANFATEVRAYRIRHAKAATALIVVIDADAHTLTERLDQLDQELGEAGVSSLQPHERVARLVPKRNIETWIVCLNGNNVDEETDYKGENREWNELVRTAAEALFQWSRANVHIPPHCIESLTRGIADLRQLEA
jgi:hypothetical protein